MSITSIYIWKSLINPYIFIDTGDLTFQDINYFLILKYGI